ncbi:hypothetical protein Cob_v006916 [Colletotrichum orbiculare MAFF 240422]|uniref:Sh3 domain-containing protein n=1 Tax=Colletotrichum orbiculare (strain 104-T / ATCC 96160 / CBS 514.97 / LARS 414 / MAFF 240422) TaxID=1213857 RepID=A0A484FQE7_COLOR|nr:hypothetical protein Cob_v006916 [Colletotrichum orbiculare MAFF 240422]
MAIDVDELILAPFREVVDSGRAASASTEAAQDEDAELARQMIKSAQVVSKEGERALGRIRPLWDSQVEKHGDAFKDTIADHDDLAEERRALEELLYDFEDFIEADTFDPAKFAEVQAATRAFALDRGAEPNVDIAASTTRAGEHSGELCQFRLRPCQSINHEPDVYSELALDREGDSRANLLKSGLLYRNVAWLYRDHWCWSGTDSKGKFGIFPQSRVNPHSLKEGLAVSHAKRSQASGPMRLFSRRRQSSAASSLSGET